ncbi:MAG: hypothetical protein R2717_09865 [Schumannella sp.]
MRAFAAEAVSTCWSRRPSSRSGVDVPNASTMVILDADRFGVAQLHISCGGRVGRGSVPGLCLFVTRSSPVRSSRERVDAWPGTLDGFALAQVDLELRREGDVLGADQSGGGPRSNSCGWCATATGIADARAAAAVSRGTRAALRPGSETGRAGAGVPQEA